MEKLLIIVGNNQLALGNIASNTESLGLKAVIISNSLTGEAREVGEAFAEKVENFTIGSVCSYSLIDWSVIEGATTICYQDQSLRRTHITGHELTEGYAATQEGWGLEQ